MRHALTAMAARQTNGGWGCAYTLDNSIMWGEYRPIPPTWITVQPPATPRVAKIFLRAAKVLNEAAYAKCAEKARDALLEIQSNAGGFPCEDNPEAPEKKHASFDDDVTTAALDFLITWWQYTKKESDLTEVIKVGDFILTSQYADSGGWPQRYPLEGTGYGKHITFNDGNFSNILSALLRLHHLTGDIRYRDAALRGGDCIIQLQGGAGEEIWAQQYDPKTLKPAWARKFEPPGYASSESIGVCNSLIELFLATGEKRFLAPLPKAFTWYDTHKLPNGGWARLYEPETQRPIYGRRDKAVIVYNRKEACTGYAWQGIWYPHAAKRAYERIEEVGREAYLKEQNKIIMQNDMKKLKKQALRLCTTMSKDGYWLRLPNAKECKEYKLHNVDKDIPIIHTGTFNHNAGILLNYLEAVKAGT